MCTSPLFKKLFLILASVAWALSAVAQPAALTVATNVNISRQAGNNAEQTIAINPQNPLNLFADDTWSVAGRYSLDGALTWNTSDVSALGFTRCLPI